jgi:hypothetical protein
LGFCDQRKAEPDYWKDEQIQPNAFLGRRVVFGLGWGDDFLHADSPLEYCARDRLCVKSTCLACHVYEAMIIDLHSMHENATNMPI